MKKKLQQWQEVGENWCQRIYAMKRESILQAGRLENSAKHSVQTKGNSRFLCYRVLRGKKVFLRGNLRVRRRFPRDFDHSRDTTQPPSYVVAEVADALALCLGRLKGTKTSWGMDVEGRGDERTTKNPDAGLGCWSRVVRSKKAGLSATYVREPRSPVHLNKSQRLLHVPSLPWRNSGKNWQEISCKKGNNIAVLTSVTACKQDKKARKRKP